MDDKKYEHQLPAVKKSLAHTSSSNIRRQGSMKYRNSTRHKCGHHNDHHSGNLSSSIFKRADRELVALNFLSNIPMKNEKLVLQQAMALPADLSSLYIRTDPDYGDMVDLLDSPLPRHEESLRFKDSDDAFFKPETSNDDEYRPRQVPGRQLDGPGAYLVSLPLTFRYRYYQQGIAVVRQWEKAMVGKAGVLDGRLFLSGNRAYPMAVVSIIPYKPGEDEGRRLRARKADERGAEVFQRPVPDWRGVRYANLLLRSGRPSSTPHSQKMAMGDTSRGEDYDPAFLDDPDLLQGKNRQVTVGGGALGPVIYSVVSFVNPRQLKDELNMKFRERHPDLPPSLTLSKIRSLKRQLVNCCYSLDLEMCTAAVACIYFEKLCLKKLVTRSNRRLALGVCLTLAYKFHEKGVTGGPAQGNKLPQILEWIDREWYASSKEVFEAEFGAFYHLDFTLLCPLYEISHHFSRLLKLIGTVPKDYIGEEMLLAYTYAQENMMQQQQNSLRLVTANVHEEEEEEEENEEEDTEEEEDSTSHHHHLSREHIHPSDDADNSSSRRKSKEPGAGGPTAVLRTSWMLPWKHTREPAR